jgi:hypothetical protein
MVWNLYNGHKITQKLKNKVKSGEIPLIRGFEVFDETDQVHIMIQTIDK